jgi:hypothetical protein
MDGAPALTRISGISHFFQALILLLSNPAWSATQANDREEENNRLTEALIVECARSRNLDPVLLYAVSLMESAIGQKPGFVGPWPWSIRTPEGGKRFPSRQAASAYLMAALERFDPKRIDVGAYQVNVGWHRQRFDAIDDMLDPRLNCEAAADILREALVSAPDDPELGVGRYHHWKDEKRARRYGKRVLLIADRVRAI